MNIAYCRRKLFEEGRLLVDEDRNITSHIYIIKNKELKPDQYQAR